jgi:polyisoprenoid-binding protein YceI
MFNHRPTLFALCISLMACASQTRVGNVYPVASESQDRVWFTGSSNIRNFTCSARQVNVSAEAALEDFTRTRNDGLPAVKSAALEVPVRSLDCGIGLQNSHLFETLNATTHPSITFVLGNYAVENSGGERLVRMNGALRIAGVERNVAIYGKVLRAENGRIVLAGDREIDVRDFGVQPPKRFFGMLRVRKEVTVHFMVAVRPLIDPLGILTASLQ